jgi:hypothetical protein
MYNFKGEPVHEEIYLKDCDGYNTQILSCNVITEELYDFRYKFPAWMDADVFNVMTSHRGDFWKARFGDNIPDAVAYANGGYERDSCRYVSGTAEEMCDIYLDLLNQMHK